MKIIKLSIISLIFVTLLTGCWGKHEPERILYVHGLGIDYKDGEYQIYSQIIDFKQVAKSDTPSTEKKQSEVGHASGKTITEAIFKLYNSADQRMYWGQLSYIVCSEQALKNNGLSNAVDTFTRYRDTRYQVWLYGTKSNVKDLLLTTPVVNTSITLSKLSDPLNSYDQKSLVEPINIRKLILGLDEPSHEVLIPMVKVSKNWEDVKEKDKMAQIVGAGVISNKKFRGFLEREKILGVRWMNKSTQTAEITISLDSEQSQFMTVVLTDVKVKVKPVVEGQSVKFDVDVKMLGELATLVTEADKDEIKQKAEEEIKKQITETFKIGLENDIDIYRLSEYLYRKNINAWKKLQEDGKIELTEDSIRTLNVTLKDLRSNRKLFSETIM